MNWRNESALPPPISAPNSTIRFFMSGAAMVNALQGGQIQAEFRGVSPADAKKLKDALGDRITVSETPWLCKFDLFFNNQKKPYDDVRVRHALSMAIDRWKGADAMSRTAFVRNVGGGRPGEIDRSVFGSPAKYSFCFAEDEEDPRWESYAASLGFSREASTVTIFPGDGITQIIDHQSRTPEDLCRSYASCISTISGTGIVSAALASMAASSASWSRTQAGELSASMLPFW